MSLRRVVASLVMASALVACGRAQAIRSNTDDADRCREDIQRALHLDAKVFFQDDDVASAADLRVVVRMAKRPEHPAEAEAEVRRIVARDFRASVRKVVVWY